MNAAAPHIEVSNVTNDRMMSEMLNAIANGSQPRAAGEAPVESARHAENRVADDAKCDETHKTGAAPPETKIKICGLSRLCDAEAVNRARPDYAGFVFYEKSRRNVSPDQAQALREAIAPAIRTVGVFVNAAPETILPLCRDGIIDIVQLHGDEGEAYLPALRKALPGVELWQAFKVRTPEDLSAAMRSGADQVLLDNGAGTGARFDWSLLEGFARPYILAGGLTPQNIPDAIHALHPCAVDVSSGVEVGGFKDEGLIYAAVAATRRR